LTDAELETLRKALEREALEPDGEPDDDVPTVQEILAARHNSDKRPPKV
jgi:hypothetical protein